jgi:hypothetical protein
MPYVEDITLGKRNMSDKTLYEPASEWVKDKVRVCLPSARAMTSGRAVLFNLIVNNFVWNKVTVIFMVLFCLWVFPYLLL